METPGYRSDNGILQLRWSWVDIELMFDGPLSIAL